ncbi:MAG: murein biosynthesis integral membrane protein MurJ [Armatimonadetes bacterium]|nr:murein biosynthesis integral membrane protein MurJ [Armatimonadota bacterium]
MPPSASPAAAQPIKTTRPMQAVLILSALFFLARFTGLLQRLIMSALLPTEATDAYTAAFRLPDLLNYLVAGGAISLTFIPIFTRSWSQGREAEAWRFFSTLISVMGLILIVLTALMMIWTGPLIAMFLPGLTAPEKVETFELAVAMTRIILPAQLFFYLGGLLVGVLNSFKRFGATGWTSAINNLVAILAGVALLHVVGPIGFAWGILLGAFAGNFLLPYLAIQRGPQGQRPNFTPRFAFGDPAVRRFFVLALPIMFGVSLPVVDQIVVSYFASSLPGGALTHLENANRLMIAAQGVLGQAAAVAAFPYLASESAAGDYRAFSEFLRLGLRRLLFVTLPVSVLLILWAHPLTRLIYGYGRYEDPQKLHETAFTFALFSVGLFAWAGQGFLARGFYALSDTRTPTIIGSVLTIAFLIPLCYAMAQLWGAVGLALSTTIGAAAYFTAILLFLNARLQKAPYSAPIGLEKIGGTLLRTGLACALMGLAGILALRLTDGFFSDDKLGDLALIAWTGTVAVFVFVASAAQFEIPEWIWLRDKIRRRRRA